MYFHRGMIEAALRHDRRGPYRPGDDADDQPVLLAAVGPRGAADRSRRWAARRDARAGAAGSPGRRWPWRCCCWSPSVASAHPLGNFTVNQYSGLAVRSDGVDVNYVLDMAEIPTAQLLASSTATRASCSRRRRRRLPATECATLASRHHAAGRRHRGQLLTVRASTLRSRRARPVCTRYGSPADSPRRLDGRPPLQYVNHNFDDRVGWREVTAVGTLGPAGGERRVPPPAPARSSPAYPADLLTSPLDVRSASLSVVAGTGGGGAGGRTGRPAGIAATRRRPVHRQRSCRSSPPRGRRRVRRRRARAGPGAGRGARVCARARQDADGRLPGGPAWLAQACGGARRRR